ncbi:hypothetical protein [Methylobacterium soli]|jgi:hypothetical protein|uniref:Uncharacterized protein n=1 Tax=Methylobacterium soli TaxID=553447 RepID=A0A6L3SWR9_9HYPH|nr:hypothetical protein [Methylobacterium soli]KAB1076591.1 hypothetical protein F6X53_23115 [Methylobacterium soli]GJE44498.1 hypothetical protein AEGHOMDF_3686 [Methylobacterium soli]
MTETLTTAALCGLNLISDAEVDAAVDAFLADPMAPPFVFKEGYRLNLGKAVRRHPGADDFVNRREVGTQLKRPFVRAAILQARPARD